MPLPLIGGALVFLQSIGTLFNSKIMAYFVVIGVLFSDASISGFFGSPGLIGSFISTIVGAVTGFNVFLPTWFLLIMFIVIPPFIWFQSAST